MKEVYCALFFVCCALFLCSAVEEFALTADTGQQVVITSESDSYQQIVPTPN